MPALLHSMAVQCPEFLNSMVNQQELCWAATLGINITGKEHKKEFQPIWRKLFSSFSASVVFQWSSSSVFLFVVKCPI